MFCRYLGAYAWIRNGARNRRGVYDCTATGFEHVQNLVLHTKEDALQIDSNNFIEALLFKLSQRRSNGKNSGIVKCVMQRAVRFHRNRDEILDLTGFTDICFDEESLASRAVDQFDSVSPFGIYVANHHSCAMPRKKKRRCAADSCSATRNDRDSVSKVELNRAKDHDRRTLFASAFRSHGQVYRKRKEDSINRWRASHVGAEGLSIWSSSRTAFATEALGVCATAAFKRAFSMARHRAAAIRTDLPGCR